ncbi:MAG TPA: AtpZ/AtpI family protein [Bacteroidales bacterium]|nr:AtpZ/AtpI family protein [Bacteroidales bacterium]
MVKQRTKHKRNQLEEGRKQFDGYARYSNLAIQMCVIIGAGVFGGVEIDQWLKLRFPVFTLILTVFSFLAAIYIAIKDFIRKK